MFATWNAAVGALATILGRRVVVPGPLRGVALPAPGSTPGPATARRGIGGPCETAGGCGFNRVCRGGRCGCPQGWEACGTGRCHYLGASSRHCGACGLACRPDQECVNGVCV